MKPLTTVRSALAALLILWPSLAAAHYEGASSEARPEASRLLGDLWSDPLGYGQTICGASDADGDLVPSFESCARNITLHDHACATACPYALALGGNESRFGDPDPTNASDPIESLSPSSAVGARIARLIAEAERLLDLVEDERVGLIGSLGLDTVSFPIQAAYFEWRGPHDEDGDGVYALEVRRCEVLVQPGPSVFLGACGAYQSYGDPDDEDASTPVATRDDSPIPWLVDTLVLLVLDVLRGYEIGIDSLRELVDAFFDRYFPLRVSAYDASVENRDEDAVALLRLHPYTLVLERDATWTREEPGDPDLTAGDPDDADPTNPLDPDSVPLPVDWDGDGYANEAEVAAGSNLLTPRSTPETDDDGDGVANEAEIPATAPGTQSGAYGIVASPKASYAAPSGWVAGTTWVDDASPRRVWVWDGVCLPAGVSYDYATCQSTSQRTAATSRYAGAWYDDGYGWRFAAQVPPLLPVTVPVVGVCEGDPRDEDHDNVPLVRVCRHDVTVYADGQLFHGPETQIGPNLGDVDDSDADEPLPQGIVSDLVGQVVDAAEGAVAEAQRLVDDAPESIQPYIDLVLQLAQSAQDQAEEAKRKALEQIDETVDGLEAFADSTQAALDATLAAVECSRLEAEAFGGRVSVHATEFVGESSPENLDALESDLRFGSQAFVAAVAVCDGPGPLDDLVVELLTFLFGLVDAFLEAVADALDAGQDIVALVTEYLGAAGEIVQGLVDQAFHEGDVLVGIVTGTYEGARELVLALVDDYQGTDWVGAVQELYQAVNGEDPGPGHAFLEFLVTDASGKAIGEARILVSRLGETEVGGTTDAQGRLRVSIAAETWYDYDVQAEDAEPKAGRVLSPAEGQAQDVNVQLERVEQLAWPAWAPWAALGALAFLLLVSRRRRR